MSEPIPVASAEAGKKTSKIIEDGNESTVNLDMENAPCQWNGQSFNKGARIAADGAVYECSYGCWVKLE
jgi:hypothetical protein